MVFAEISTFDFRLLYGYNMAMVWAPEYQITNGLLLIIRQIGEVLGEIKSTQLTANAVANIQYKSRVISIYASTSIEGNPLSLTDIKRILKHKPVHLRDTEKEIVNYNRALDYVYDKVRRKKFTLSIAELEKIQSIVVKDLLDNPEDVGQLRKKPVIIRDPRRSDVIVFVPPDHQDVPRLTNELCGFINHSAGIIDPLILAGIFHRQSVIIHPFMDGNGRTMRLITTALLGMTGIDLFELFSFENYYNQNVAKYFQRVGLQGDYYELQATINFTNWLEYFAEGILDELKRIQKVIPASIATKRIPKQYDQVLSYIKQHGSISQAEYGEISPRSLAARKKDFAKMRQLGLINAKGQGKSTYYVLSE